MTLSRATFSRRAMVMLPVCTIAALATSGGSVRQTQDDRIARLDRVLQSWIDDGGLAGLVARVHVNGTPVYERAFGWADREADRRMTLDTIFRIASQTKAITTAAALVLIEEGLLGLDDPVSRYLPFFTPTSVADIQSGSPARVPVRRPITVRDLLAHTAGLSYGTDVSLPIDPPKPAPIRTAARFKTPASALKPPYPNDKLRLEEEATLKLRLTIDARGSDGIAAVESTLDGLREVPVDRGVQRAVLALMRELAADGPHGAHRFPLTDLTVAAAAQQAGIGVLHFDRHLEQLGERLGVDSHWISTPSQSGV